VTTFAELGLERRLLQALDGLGYEEPTPVQAAAIPPLAQGRDVLAQAATGTGKTAAFVLPLLQRLIESGTARRSEPFALVLVPTRELALQVAEAAQRYGAQINARVLPVYGGQPMGMQIKALQRGVDLVVATPGRALDHLRRGYLKFPTLQVLVLDEADEMLDMGFAEDLEAIMKTLPVERQTSLFSATLPGRITAMANRYLKDPVELRIAVQPQATADTAATVRQVAYLVSRSQKPDALVRLLDLEDPEAALVFCRTRVEVDVLVERLHAQGRSVQALHGGISQAQREKVLKRLRDGKSDVLVATDVAARGLDVSRLSHVINYDVPSSPDTYVHRIGRTGRAGRGGTALTLVEPRERQQVRQIERLVKRRLELGTLPTTADLRARRLALTGAALREALVSGGLERFRAMVEALAQEFDPLDVAAAGVKLAHGDEPEIAPTPSELKHSKPAPRPSAVPPAAPVARAEAVPAEPAAQVPVSEAPPPREPDSRVEAPRPAARPAREPRPHDRTAPRIAVPRQERERPYERSESAGREARHDERKGSSGGHAERRPERSHGFESGSPLALERLVLSAGRQQGLRPADIVGALIKGAHIPAVAIGSIELSDDFTIIELHGEALEDCVTYLRKEGLRGQPISVKRQHPEEPAADSERPAFKPRSPAGAWKAKPGGPWKPKPAGTWDGKPARGAGGWKPKPGSRPAGPWKPKPAGSWEDKPARPAGPWKPKPAGAWDGKPERSARPAGPWKPKPAGSWEGKPARPAGAWKAKPGSKPAAPWKPKRPPRP